MTKKIFAIAISVLFTFGLLGTVFAEQSAATFGGKKYYEQQVFVDAYNNAGTAIPANSVVILDTTGTAADSLGAYVTTTSIGEDVLVFGVTEEEMSQDRVGRVCVRGPHRVRIVSGGAGVSAVRRPICASSSAGYARIVTTSASGTAYGILGVSIEASGTAATAWVWIQPHISQ